MVTRKVDRADHLAGFIYNWVKHFAAQVEQLYVISWQEGDSSGLPDNVTVIHLPTRQNKLLKLLRLKILAWKYLGKVDGVFCHQMPIYTIIVGPLARARRKKVISWYTHRQVDLKMRLMEKIAHVVVTASKESFRLPSKKLVVTGHGIDTELFSYADHPLSEVAQIISIGRISPTKRYEIMIDAVAQIHSQGGNISFSIIGETGLKDHQKYQDKLKAQVTSLNLSNIVHFLGSRPHQHIPDLLHEAYIFVNLSDTGSLDKAVLEAMAVGCLPLTSNEAFVDILPQEFQVTKNDPADLATKIDWVLQLDTVAYRRYAKQMRDVVVDRHSIVSLVQKISNLFV